MSKYGQEDARNQFQRNFDNLVRLTILALSIGAVATLIWLHLRSPPNSFYYLFAYWYSWLYCHLPFGCSQVAISNQQVLQPIINQIGELIKSCSLVFSVTSFLSFVGLRYYFVWYETELEKKRFLRGSRLLKPQELNREIDTARDNEGKSRYPPTGLDLHLARERVRLPHTLTYRHIALVGVAGTGKTQLISSILFQLAAFRGQKCFVLDLNGQYYARFGQVGDKILSLYDPRSEAWSFYGERGVPAEFFAQSMVEVNEGGGGNSKFFGNAGRALLTDVITRSSSIEEVWQNLTSGDSKLLQKLQGGLSPALLGAPGQAAGVIATAIVELGFLKNLNHSNKSEEFFSLTDWVLSESEDWVFLIVRDVDLAATKALLRLWVDLVVAAVLQREEEKQYPHLWVVCDELPGLGVLSSIGKLLSQGRKYKSTMIAGYQVRGQIQHLYGKDGAKEIIAGLQNKLIFRTPDPTDAKEESLTLGEQEVVEVTSNAQLGELGENDQDSLQRNIKTRPVVMPSELQNLADMKAYVKLCEFDPCLISFDFLTLPQINEPTRRRLSPSTNLNLHHENHNQNENTNQSFQFPETDDSDFENTLDAQEDFQWDIKPDEENSHD